MSSASNTSIDTIEAKLLHDRAQYLDSAGSIRTIDPMEFAVNEEFPEMIDGRYRVCGLIGFGGNGLVYEGVDTSDGALVAIKMTNSKETAAEDLINEKHCYELLSKGQNAVEGLPKIFYSGSYQGREVLVMERLRSSVKGWMKFCGGKMSQQSVFQVGLEIIDRLQYINERGIVHGDIKPENLLIGNDGETIYIVDFGLSSEFRDERTGKHIDLTEQPRLFVGTPDYASLNAHNLFALSRRDDLESLAYSMINMQTGTLPWMNIRRSDYVAYVWAIGDAKKEQDLYSLCQDLGIPMVKFIEYVRGLEFEETPNYDFLRELLRNALTASGGEYDGQFDWSSALRN